MKKDFFEALKSYFIEDHQEDLHKLIPYYETLLQHKDKLTPLLNDCQEWDFTFYYRDNDSREYNIGSLTVYLHRNVGELIENEWSDYYEQEGADYYYIIAFIDEPRMWGYCCCEPEDEGYNKEYHCCGVGCDWYAPSFEVDKVYSICCGSFEGLERDIWELEKKWDTYLEVYKDKKKLAELDQIETQLKELEKRKNELLS